MKTLLCLACLLAAGRMVLADPLKPGATPDVLTPKTKSVFTGSPDDHNPFWPIGWVKMEATATVTQTAAPLIPHAEDFDVTTILLNEPRLAVINGKDMAEGEVGVVNVNGEPVVVQVMAVEDGRVRLRWQNRDLIIPLHRDEDLTLASPTP